MLIFGQKPFYFCTTRLKTPQPILPKQLQKQTAKLVLGPCLQFVVFTTERKGQKIYKDSIFQPSSYTRWNWRLLGSLYLSLSFNEDESEDLDYSDKNITSAGYALNQRNIPVTMEAKLDASYDQSYVDQTTDEHHRLFEWVRLSEIKADRKLQCTVTSLQPGKSKYFHGKAKIRMASRSLVLMAERSRAGVSV